MIRLVLLLCVGLYLSLMILGQDHGQVRYGLMPAPEQPAAPEPVRAAPEPVLVASEPSVFIPAQTVMEPAVPQTPETEVTVQAASVVAAPDVVGVTVPEPTPEIQPEPEIPGGKLFFVSATGANVREGPGTDYGVLGSLAQGEQVLVVIEDTPVDGWSRVRLEGDGGEGYIATRLLSELP